MSQVIALLYSSDYWVASRLQDWCVPSWLTRWMRVTSQLGNGWLWIAAPLALTWFVTARARLLLELALATVLANAAIVTLKRLFRRARPVAARPCPPLGLPASGTFDFDEFSFPSGHTVNAFALAVLLTAFLPHWAPLWFAMAVNIGVARILLRFHHATDVLAGAAIGTLLAAGIHLVLGA
jgi:undecaprenyl-diphosphatase